MGSRPSGASCSISRSAAWASPSRTPWCRTWPAPSSSISAWAITACGPIAPWATRRRAAAHAGACDEGNVGAGTGATVGKLHTLARAMRGGLGCAVVEGAGFVTAAIMAVNAVGDVRDGETGRLVAGARDAAARRTPGGHRGGAGRGHAAARLPSRRTPPSAAWSPMPASARRRPRGWPRWPWTATRGRCRRRISATDGDTLFCLSIGDRAADPVDVGARAARAVAQAILRGVRAATGLPGLPAARDLNLTTGGTP